MVPMSPNPARASIAGWKPVIVVSGRARLPPLRVNTATATAMPSAAPTWRNALPTPEATVIVGAGTVRIRAVADAGKAMATPRPETISGTRIAV